MESLRNEPIVFGGSPAGMGGGSGDSLVSALVVSSLLGRNGVNGSGAGFADFINEKSVGEARRDIKDSESEIRESIHNQTMHSSSEFRALDGRLASIDKEAVSARYESQIAAKDAQYSLTNKIDCETGLIKNQLGYIQTNVDKQFSDLKTDLFRSLTAIRERELNDEIQSLRREREFLAKENQTNEIVKQVLSVLRPGTTPNT